MGGGSDISRAAVIIAAINQGAIDAPEGAQYV
jgi:hypothetical protein